MGEQVLLLVIGFVLTSVVGGLLGLFFQRRTWSHQHRAQQRDQDRDQALKIFEEVSSLLDRRLYRMRQVFWAARRRAQGKGDTDVLPEALEQYRSVVTTWNDNLNRNLALVHTYFGSGARQELEDELFEEFSAIGRALEWFVQDATAPDAAGVEVPQLGRRLNWLGRQVYAFNVHVLELLQADQVGRDAPGSRPRPENRTPLPQLGHQGRAVQRLQQALHDAGLFDDRVDGSFGKDTGAAVRELQRSAGLEVDGVVGPATWGALDSPERRSSSSA
jgi:Putative peptidoglycan binding domain